MSAMIATTARASITLAAAILASVARGQVPMSPAIAQSSPQVAHKQPLAAPAPTKRASVPAKNAGGPSQEDLRQLDQILQGLRPKERKEFNKAFKQLTPEGRKQLIEGIKRQRSGTGTSPHVSAPRVLKAPPPLPRRLVF
jgi:hypothetical protein